MSISIMFGVVLLALQLSSPAYSLSGSCETVCTCLADSADCQYSHLDNIPNDLSPYIIKLELAGNKIKYVSNMEHYMSLEYLDLSENEIVQIKSNSFRESYQLLSMNLANNKLGSVSSEDLLGLSGLSSLSLSHNEIDNISAGAFEHCRNLQVLDLSSNKIRDLNGETFRGKVKEKLRELDLSHNQLEQVPTRALQGIPHLTVLDLSENNFQVLYLEDFERISEALQDLRLSGCGLYTLQDEAFKGLSFLLKLDISNNGLHEVPSQSFRHLHMLEELEIGRNKIGHFRATDFDHLKNLKVFSVDGCKTDLVLEEGIFKENSNLETIHVKCPHLKSLPEHLDLKHLSVLKRLSFHGSGLSSLPRNILNYEDLHSLDLSGNPLDCDCRLQFISPLLSLPRPVKVSGVCAEPERLQNVQLRELSEEDLKCDQGILEQNLNIIIIVALIIIFVLTVAIVYCCCWRKKGCSFSKLFRKKERPKLKLSRTFSGSKSEIRVVQNKNLVGSDKGFLELSTTLSPEYSNLVQADNRSEHLYTELAEVTVRETVPSYHIPVTNVQCPDVKISEL